MARRNHKKVEKHYTMYAPEGCYSSAESLIEEFAAKVPLDDINKTFENCVDIKVEYSAFWNRMTVTGYRPMTESEIATVKRRAEKARETKKKKLQSEIDKKRKELERLLQKDN